MGSHYTRHFKASTLRSLNFSTMRATPQHGSSLENDLVSRGRWIERPLAYWKLPFKAHPDDKIQSVVWVPDPDGSAEQEFFTLRNARILRDLVKVAQYCVEISWWHFYIRISPGRSTLLQTRRSSLG